MKWVKRYPVILGALIGFALPAIFLVNRGSEQYTVDGFAHGVVLCQAKAIVINLRHENDKEIKKLFEVAKNCSNYKEEE